MRELDGRLARGANWGVAARGRVADQEGTGDLLDRQARDDALTRNGRLFFPARPKAALGSKGALCPSAHCLLTYASANRKGRAFTRALQRIARRYPRAKKIHLVMDNLSTHSLSSVVATLGARQAQQLWRRFEVHHTPKHASWLNVAEMEASLVSRECLGSARIGHLHTLKSGVAAGRRRTEAEQRTIRWKFTVADARRVFRYDGIITPRSEH